MEPSGIVIMHSAPMPVVLNLVIKYIYKYLMARLI